MQHAREGHAVVLDLKSVADDGRFEGYASLFHVEDLGRDVIVPGAFRASLARKGPMGIRLLYQHKPDEPIGVWEEIREDARGLHVRGRIATDVARAREVLGLMRAGAIDGLSIGFRVIRSTADRARRVRRITQVDLWEISVVTFPMQPGARIARVTPPAYAVPISARSVRHMRGYDLGPTIAAAAQRMRHRIGDTQYASPAARAHALAGEQALLSLMRLGLSGPR
ncbi:MAG: HK97 family phage prohead protease [Hyphomicrobiaceae bacterium]